MSDSKGFYSDEAKHNFENLSDQNILKAYILSKAREKKHNDEWLKRKVNINDIVLEFAPNASLERNNQKLIFKGEEYTVITDLNAGYLRIQNNKGRYVKLDGTVGTDRETHFKIKTREEM